MRRRDVILTVVATALVAAGCIRTPGSPPESGGEKRQPLVTSGPHDTGPPLLTPAEAHEFLTSDHLQQLDRRFSELQNAYKHGRITDEELRNSCRAFYDTDQALEQHYDLWVRMFPKSYSARLARGIHYLKVGSARRGDRMISLTTDAQIQGMKEANARASQDFTASLALDEKPLMTYLYALSISMDDGDAKASRRLVDEAIKIDPANFIVRYSYLGTLQEKWGGSLEQMRAFLEESRPTLSPARLHMFEALIADEEGTEQFQATDYVGAAKAYRRAADLGRNECLPCLADALVKLGRIDDGIEVLSKAIDLTPGDAGLRFRRASAYTSVGKSQEAFSDLSVAAEAGDSAAQNNLGIIYMQGIPGVTAPNVQTGLEWFRKSAAQGNSDGARNLALASRILPNTAPRVR